MILDYIGVNEVSGSLIVLDDVENASYEEVVDIRLGDGSRRTGRIVQLDGKRAVVQVFEGTRGISLENTRTAILTGRQSTLFRVSIRKIISTPAFRALMC